MALFFAYRIMTGKTTFKRVPKFLKDAVKEILEEEGLGHLAQTD